MRLTFGNLALEGVSRGGDRTWFRVHPPGLAFDVGRGALGLAGARDVFITHGHLDHCLGLPFVLSYREGSRKPEPAIYQSLIRQAERPPEEILFLDDKVSFVEGALSQGLTAWQFRSPQELRQELARHRLW